MATKTKSLSSRALGPADLDRVVEIDRAIVGRSRRGFFEKRLEAALAVPDDFVVVGVDGVGGESELQGYGFARIHSGEYGTPEKIAAIDAIGVAPDSQSGGIGRMVLEAMDGRLRRKGVAEIRTQADWRFHGLLKFFESTGFLEAPVHILERPAQPTHWEESLLDDPELESDAVPGGKDIEFPTPDRIEFRSLRAADLNSVVRIDERITGQNRREYYQGKLQEMLDRTGMRVSRVAEIDGDVTGVIMARVDYGEFGRTEPVAVIDTINVDPGYRHRGVGRALMSRLLIDLHALRVEAVRTTVRWNDFDLLAFLETCQFTPSQRLVFKRTVPD